MKVLLVAPQFPPLATPQSLRWYYLGRELASRGVQVHVLAGHVTPDVAQVQPVPSGVEVTRAWAAGFEGWWERRRDRVQRGMVASSDRVPGTPACSRTAFKNRLAGAVRQRLTSHAFPGEQAAWIGPARVHLVSLLATFGPDIVVSSHEPAAALVVGCGACDHGVPWVVDLGDPVCSDYARAAWKNRLLAIEEVVCMRAAAVTVTTEGTRDLLLARHRQVLDLRRVHVVSQGYDTRFLGPRTPPVHAGARLLELYYSGRVYAFRDPRPLIEAVAAVPGVRLTLRCPDPPRWLSRLVHNATRVRLLPATSHDRVLAEQAAADVLVDIGNRQSAQMPGKLVEYLAARRPLLHLSASVPDPAADRVVAWQRGWVCHNEALAIASLLGEIGRRKARGELDSGVVLDDSLTTRLRWEALGATYVQVLEACLT